MDKKGTPIKTSSIIHFVIITLILVNIEGYLRAIDLINNGCILGEECETYVLNGKILIFSVLSTFLIFFMILRIPLFKYTGLNLKYFAFMTIVILGGDLLIYLSKTLFFNLLT